jgi:hypothetical protein
MDKNRCEAPSGAATELPTTLVSSSIPGAVTELRHFKGARVGFCFKSGPKGIGCHAEVNLRVESSAMF